GEPKQVRSARRVDGAPFETEAREVLGRLRGAVEALVASAPEPITRATDLQHALGVRAPLAWQVYRWATADDPFGTVAFVPKPEAMAKVLAAARAARFDSSAVDRVAR